MNIFIPHEGLCVFSFKLKSYEIFKIKDPFIQNTKTSRTQICFFVGVCVYF